MALSKFDEDGHRRLAKLLEIVGTDLGNVYNAVTKVLKGERDRGRRIYLRGELTRSANRKIHEAIRKGTQVKAPASSISFVTTPSFILDSDEWRYEQTFMENIHDDEPGEMKFKFPREIINDAWRHEQALLHGIPEDDR